ncbi:MAG: hypothetical protein Q6358_02610 [Candidatus Brocadiales bacterium]|nr:hypothetical protein [Candidatus Brocadiales bacterium]
METRRSIRPSTKSRTAKGKDEEVIIWEASPYCSGLPELRTSDLIRDFPILKQARTDAFEIVSQQAVRECKISQIYL